MRQCPRHYKLLPKNRCNRRASPKIRPKAMHRRKGAMQQRTTPLLQQRKSLGSVQGNIPAFAARHTYQRFQVPHLADLNRSACNAIRNQKGKISRGADGKKWVCLCVPPDMGSEKEQDPDEDTVDFSDEDEDEDVDEDEEVTRDADIGPIRPRCDGGIRCICKKPAENYPNYTWIVTQKGFELSLEWLSQVQKRYPENFDMYIFDDFNGHRVCEVMENILLAFAKEEKKIRKDPMAMWSVLESMAIFLRGDHLHHWKGEPHLILIGWDGTDLQDQSSKTQSLSC